MKKISKILSCFILLICTACSKEDNNTFKAIMYKDAKFDCADLNLTTDDFTNMGYEFGDSFDITFPDGTIYKDVPYYNGYYVKTGSPVIVSYPSNDYVLIANNNSDLWSLLKLNDGEQVTIKLNTKGKYLETQAALGKPYLNDRLAYDSDEQFANFRSLKGGNLKDNFLYRGASPVDNCRNRASYVNNLLEQHNIKTIIDLADSNEDMEKYFASEDFNSEYTKDLYENGKDIVLSMSSDYSSDKFKQSFANGLRFIMENQGPIYIHCLEGKDRTGFVCFVIEALMGATYEEMLNDYMTTYQNYFGITQKDEEEKYNAIANLYFVTFVEYLSGKEVNEETKQEDFSEYAKAYLLSSGMSEDEINQLVSFLAK